MVLFIWAALGAIGGVASGIAGAAGASAQARAQRAAAESQARQLEKRAQAREYTASQAIRVGNRQAKALLYQGNVKASLARAGIGGTGVDVNSGSAANMVTRIKQVADSDAEMLRFQAWEASSIMKREAQEIRAQAEDVRVLGKQTADVTSTMGIASGVGSVFNSLSQFASSGATEQMFGGDGKDKFMGINWKNFWD